MELNKEYIFELKKDIYFEDEKIYCKGDRFEGYKSADGITAYPCGASQEELDVFEDTIATIGDILFEEDLEIVTQETILAESSLAFQKGLIRCKLMESLAKWLEEKGELIVNKEKATEYNGVLIKHIKYRHRVYEIIYVDGLVCALMEEEDYHA